MGLMRPPRGAAQPGPMRVRPPRVLRSKRINTLVRKVAKVDKPASKEAPPAPEQEAEPGNGAEEELLLKPIAIDKKSVNHARSSVEQVKAIAAKISAARRLARKLAEEKAAASALQKGDELADIVRRKKQLNAAEAAAAAARADALARATRQRASARSREAARLAAENKALLEVLEQAATGNPSIMRKLKDIRSRFRNQVPTGTVDLASQTVDSVASPEAAASAPSAAVRDTAPPVATPQPPAAPAPAPAPADTASVAPIASPAAPAKAAADAAAPSQPAPTPPAADSTPAAAAGAPAKPDTAASGTTAAAASTSAAPVVDPPESDAKAAPADKVVVDEKAAGKAAAAKEATVGSQGTKDAGASGSGVTPIIDIFKGALQNVVSSKPRTASSSGVSENKPASSSPAAAAKQSKPPQAPDAKVKAPPAVTPSPSQAPKPPTKEPSDTTKAPAYPRISPEEPTTPKPPTDASATKSAPPPKAAAEAPAKTPAVPPKEAKPTPMPEGSVEAKPAESKPDAPVAPPAAKPKRAPMTTAEVLRQFTGRSSTSVPPVPTPPKPPVTPPEATAAAPETPAKPVDAPAPAVPVPPALESKPEAKAAEAAAAAAAEVDSAKAPDKPAAAAPEAPPAAAASTDATVEPEAPVVVEVTGAAAAPVEQAAPPAAVEAPAVDVEIAPPEVVAPPAPVEVAPEPLPPPPPPPPPLSQVISEAVQRRRVVFTDVPPRPGASIWLFIDKNYTVFKDDDNEHHMQLKVGINKWEDIFEYDIRKITAAPGIQHVYGTQMELPEEIFALDFVVQDFRSGKVDNNMGSDWTLQLVDAPSEEDVIERRVREYEASEGARLSEIEAAEDAIAEEVEQERIKTEKATTQAWWKERRAQLREMAHEQVQQELQGNVPGAADHIQGVFKWEQGRPKAGTRARILYNRDCSDLRHRKDLLVHVGCNGWAAQHVSEYPLQRVDHSVSDGAGVGSGDWYAAEVMIPGEATVLDFVFSDADRQVWDNHHNQDYHTSVFVEMSVDELEEARYRMLVDQHLDADTERARQAARKQGERIALRASAAAKRRAQQRRVLYTNPLRLVAGQTAEVFYNPDMTSLRGRPEVYVRGSWNRWTHDDTIPITKLEPSRQGGIGFLRATVDVPWDALVCDLVFLDSANEHSGFYDNNNGLDYHVPVEGAKGTLPSLHVVHVSVELAPIAKVGGMGDVVTALGRAVQEHGHSVEVVMPKFDCMKYDYIRDLKEIRSFHWNGTYIRIFRGTVEDLPVTFIEPDNGYFWVGCVYGRSDDSHRFSFFCGAALEYLKNHADRRPDVLHCHDWPTAPVAFGDCGGARSVFTIHNLNYGADLIGQAMGSCSVATTVSPTYAQEISGHPAIAPNLGKMFGVRNGIDMDIWDPSMDPFVPVQFEHDTFHEGKAAAKRALRQRMNISDTDVPVVGVVTRLTHQKGIHLIKHAAWRTLERGGQFVLLGTAPDPRVQRDFNELANELSNQYNDRVTMWFSFDEPLSHLIYAGCDMLLVPSMFEPCGLTQMIAMRYGTVPVVRKTGGLADTVFDVDHDVERAEEYGMEVNGFNFEGTDSGGLDYALNRAISTWYNDREFFSELAKRCMVLDWSWNSPAQDYIELYYKALKG